jgi:uncharacterized protein YhaN
MKKLLSILWTVSLTAIVTSGVIACKNPKQINKQSSKKQIPVVEIQTKLIEDINNEKLRKMKYFNELNSIIQKNKTELVKQMQILESKNKYLEQKQSYFKEGIKKIAQEIEQLENQVGITGSEAVELSYKKKIKVFENNKNNEILELIIE